MEGEEVSHELESIQEKNLDGLIQEWGSDLVVDWTERYGEEATRGMHRTALITICRVREARVAVHKAQLDNARIAGNRAAGISDEELATHIAKTSGLAS